MCEVHTQNLCNHAHFVATLSNVVSKKAAVASFSMILAQKYNEDDEIYAKSQETLVSVH